MDFTPQTDYEEAGICTSIQDDRYSPYVYCMPQNDFLYAQVRECRTHVITLLLKQRNGRMMDRVTANEQG